MADYLRRMSSVSDALRESIYIKTIRCFFIFYILVGLPTGFQGRFLPLYFRSHGMSLTRVGLYRLLVLPWLLKGIWSSYIGRDTDVRMWLNYSLLLLTCLCLVASHIHPDNNFELVTVLIGLNLITSVQDTAVDSLLMDAFTPTQLLMGNIAQSVGERFGAVLSGGIFAWYIEVLTWNSVFYIMAFLYAIGLLTSFFFLPDFRASYPLSRRISARATASFESRRDSVVDAAKKFYSEASMWMVFFVLFYKIGEVGVFNLLPLFLIDKGINASEVGLWFGIIGQAVAIIGSTSTAFFSFNSMIWPLTYLMFVRSGLILMSWSAVMFWDKYPQLCYASGILSTVLLSLTGGGISTCTQTLMMQLSQRVSREERSKHYAIYSFGELLAKLLFASIIGAIAQATSYEFAFAIFTMATAAVVPYIWFAPPDVYIEMEY